MVHAKIATVSFTVWMSIIAVTLINLEFSHIQATAESNDLTRPNNLITDLLLRNTLESNQPSKISNDGDHEGFISGFLRSLDLGDDINNFFSLLADYIEGKSPDIRKMLLLVSSISKIIPHQLSDKN